MRMMVNLKWVAPVLLVSLLTFPVLIRAQAADPVVVISPGHGWWDSDSERIDPGAIHGELVEKDINLDVARYTRDYLSRCPVEVHLTRNGDDPDHTLSDVDEIVNGYDPNLAISIHTNSGDGHPSGTEGWYTVDGYDDEQSKELAASLADHIHARLGIKDRGAKPETANRHGSLYIHWWDAPSALVEIAFLQGDAELLRTQKDDFGRALAQAILEDLGLDPNCADWAISNGVQISTYFPGERKINQLGLRNDGLVRWGYPDYFLVNAGNEYGANTLYPLYKDIDVGETATWEIPSVAPSKPGIFWQTWQLKRNDEPIEEVSSVYIVVVPEEARQLKQDIDEQIEQLKGQGEQEIEKFIQQLEQDALNWVTQDLPNIICPQLGIVIGLTGVIIMHHRQRQIRK